VSEEVGVTSNDDDDVALDLDDNIAVEAPSKTSPEFRDDLANKTQLPVASNVDCQDTSTVTPNPESSDEQNRKVSVEQSHEAIHESNNESSVETSSGSPVADSGPPQKTRNVPGKALPVATGSVNPRLSAVDSKPDDPLFGAEDATKMQSSESRRDQGVALSTLSDIYTTDVKSKKSQQSKKSDTKSVSMFCVELTHP